MAYLPKIKKETGNTTPANKQEKKKCPVCQKEKSISSGFYKSASPLFSDDGCVPICICCVKNDVVNDDGTINLKKFKVIMQRLDKPLYWSSLESAYNQYRKEHGFLSDDEIAKHGKEIVALYFKNINSLPQNKNKSFADSERDNFISQGNISKSEYDRINRKYNKVNGASTEPIPIANVKTESDGKFKNNEFDIGNFIVTDAIKSLFGYGYSDVEYKKMYDKYEKLKLNYTLQTNLHQEALATYVRFKVKEEDATAKGNVDEAKKWYDAAQNAAASGKLTPKQLSAADLQKGVNSFSELTMAIEQATDVISILPKYKNQPHDAPDFNIYCYVNYARKLKGLPTVEYEDIYKFYDDKMEEYLKQYGDPNGIFTESNRIMLKNRPNIEKFIELPKDYDDLSDDSEDEIYE